MKKRIEIKNVKDEKVLYASEKEHNTLKVTLEEAVSNGADLTNADLRNADLNGADLRNADLRNADLSGADLSGADLSGADLECANLRHTQLIETDLREANLYSCDLCYADLSWANLSGCDASFSLMADAKLCDAILNDAELNSCYLKEADLTNADLTNANFSDANLCKAEFSGVAFDDVILDDATLIGAKNVPHAPMTCPEEGSFIAWKKIDVYNEGYIGDFLVKLEIPADARRSSATGKKCRCDKAKVLEIISLEDRHTIDEITNLNYTPCVYKVGEMVYPDSFDEDRWNECSNGIHFFMDKENAVRY